MNVWIFTPFSIEASAFFYEELMAGRMLYMDEGILKLNPLCPVKGESLRRLIGRLEDQSRGDFFWRDGTCNLFAKTFLILTSSLIITSFFILARWILPGVCMCCTTCWTAWWLTGRSTQALIQSCWC